MPPGERLEQFLHNASTWRDGLDVERVTGGLAPGAAELLRRAGVWLDGVRGLALRALELHHQHDQDGEQLCDQAQDQDQARAPEPMVEASS